MIDAPSHSQSTIHGLQGLCFCTCRHCCVSSDSAWNRGGELRDNLSVSQSVKTTTGLLTDGAPYEVQVPTNFDGTLLLYSHGYVFDGASDPTPIDASDPVSQGILLSQGHALAGSSYAQKGWAVKVALRNQVSTLDRAKQLIAKETGTQPSIVIPWGVSMGGDVTAGPVQQNIGSFQGAMLACAVDGGAVPIWNQQLTALFAFKQLIDPALKIVELTSTTEAEQQLAASKAAVTEAETTAAGRARLGLVAALADLPGWFWNGYISSQPSSTDFTAQLSAQIEWLETTDLPFSFLGREDLEAKAGGNPSWTIGVQYASLLKKSIDANEVRALYASVPASDSVSLAGDLATLQHAPQITADPKAVTYLQNAIDINGETGDIPILTMHTIGDGLVSPQNETAYKNALDAAGNGNNLAQVYVDNAGHCEFNPAELVAGIDTVRARILTDTWAPTPSNLNKLADKIVKEVPTAADVVVTTYDAANPFGGDGVSETRPPNFVSYKPGQPLRPYRQGYTLVSADGQLSYFASPPRGSLATHISHVPIVGIATTPAGNGYWLVNASGAVFTKGSAKFYGQVTPPTPGQSGIGQPHPMPASIVGIAATAYGKGYWLFASNGQVFAFGAPSYGQITNQLDPGLNAAITAGTAG